MRFAAIGMLRLGAWVSAAAMEIFSIPLKERQQMSD